MAKSKPNSPRQSRKDSHVVELAESWRRERPDLNHDELLLQIYIMRLGRIVESAYDKMCRTNYRISSAEMRVLLALRRIGPPFAKRPTDLFRALLMTSGAITKQVNRLQRAGLVVRQPDPSYAGGFLINLTDRGRAVADDAVSSFPLIAQATKVLGSQRLKQAVRFCEELLIELEPSRAGEAGHRPGEQPEPA